MEITCTSDLHGSFPALEGGDLLIIAGDMTAAGTKQNWIDFFSWLAKQKYDKKVIIAGNHDNFLQRCDADLPTKVLGTQEVCDYDYLCDSSVEYRGFKIYGTPWTKTFPGMNPHCMAFTVDTDYELMDKFCLIPEDTDILITHTPPYGILDKTSNKERTGSHCLRNLVLSRDRLPSLKVNVFGHIHESYSEYDTVMTKFINASHMNRLYQPVNDPIRIKL